ncbi:hypothetical protein F5Y13DRAFT_30360 [Hypoxylon sp. FL1857]|nr:hypothetical protein F5Y13DRAFT_30360 [Hypoxylon sp. FL1857]
MSRAILLLLIMTACSACGELAGAKSSDTLSAGIPFVDGRCHANVSMKPIIIFRSAIIFCKRLASLDFSSPCIIITIITLDEVMYVLRGLSRLFAAFMGPGIWLSPTCSQPTWAWEETEPGPLQAYLPTPPSSNVTPPGPRFGLFLKFRETTHARFWWYLVATFASHDMRPTREKGRVEGGPVAYHDAYVVANSPHLPLNQDEAPLVCTIQFNSLTAAAAGPYR